jgi:prevent-host-death family protein
MPAQHVSVAEAKAKFSALIESVLHHGERYVIERHGREVAAIVSVDELAQLEQRSPAAARPAGALALVGAWQDVPADAIDALLADLRTARDRDAGRTVTLER